MGENTIIDRSIHPPIISHLHYEFRGWLGDDILEAFPCFIVTQRLKDALDMSSLTGYMWDDVEISVSQEFRDFFPGRNIVEKFYWLKIIGSPNIDDFWITDDHRLTVTGNTLNILKRFNFNHCDILEVDC